MDDARLCLEVIKTAAEAGAVVVNYVEAVGFEKREGTIRGVRAVDHVGGGELSISSRQVLNATGPWVDAVCRLAGDQGEPHLRPTKGVHLVAVITDEVTRRLGVRRRERTSRTPLDGTPREPWLTFRKRTLSVLQAQGLAEATAWHLVHRYGRHAQEVADLVRATPSLARP